MESTKSNPFTNKMEINLQMFGTLMLNRVGGEVDGVYVVAVHHHGLSHGAVELQELAKPAGFCHCISHTVVLRLGAR